MAFPVEKFFPVEKCRFRSKNEQNILKRPPCTSRTIREEQNDESNEFINIFGSEILYLEGGLPSGFYMVEETVYPTRLYVVDSGKSMTCYPVPLKASSLSAKHVVVLDAGMKIFVWRGRQAMAIRQSKGRLIAEKINKIERKNNAEIFSIVQGCEDQDFWKCFGGLDLEDLKLDVDVEVYKPTTKKLYCNFSKKL